MFMSALNIAAMMSGIIILAIRVLALAIADCQSSVIQKMRPALWLASIHIDQTKHGRIDYNFTAKAMRVNTRVRCIVVGDFDRGK
jgi:hypothetical protein